VQLIIVPSDFGSAAILAPYDKQSHAAQ